ncbi:MAG: threonine synthase [Chloroflexota bacterium]|nr:threonine synthase [Chloroflexota bacterium]
MMATAPTTIGSTMTNLRCTYCGTEYDADVLQTLCPKDGRVLAPQYDLRRAAQTMTKESLIGRQATMWRYTEIMPARDPEHVVTLGEGWTPLLTMAGLEPLTGLSNIWAKDESRNPTGSFKDRGLGAAVTRARELGVTAVAIPSAGNAASAMSAFAARAGMDAFVFMPQDTPDAMKAESAAYGAHVFLVNGLINDCGAIIRQQSGPRGWFDVSTLKEPYRAEGKKTLGLELVEQLGWRVPDVIIYPTGGGTGIVGMWKAFAELEAMGLIGPERPKMVVVQAADCAPIVRAFEQGERHAALWENAHTIAPGMRVPVAVGDYLILDAVRESGGTCITVTDNEMLELTPKIAAATGIWPSPEASSTVVAARKLRKSGWLKEDDEVLCFFTSGGIKHLDLATIPTGPILTPGDANIGDIIDAALGQRS